ncbi:DUF7344 domain-containing protein [Halorussus marinus]|uniref:DUF7344 domain-containing protein n=1 Tax=Halorussus marinus TaxID=2505976 RepID=UPI001B2FF8C3|nr:hypothetical protein [Halorussus marinus]
MSDDTVRAGTSEDDHVLRSGRAVATPPFDVLFELLSESRRRYALYALTSTEDGLAEVEALADDVALWEARADDVALTDERRSAIGDALREKHLPRLADAEVVDYDERSDVVRYWRQPTLEEYLEHTHFKEFDAD